MVRRIWAIADTHLSLANPKPMDIFGAHWHNHAHRIREYCGKLIDKNDLLLIPGDISWALKRKDADIDLAFIAEFPGTKILCKGNHDYWWNSDKPLNYPGLHDTPFILPDQSLGVAGTRGWIPISAQMSAEEKSYNGSIISREVKRLAKRLAVIDHCKTKIVMSHYPPLEEFRETLEMHAVSTILYGHLHLGGSEHPLSEVWHGMKCICVASDRINFIPKLIQALSES